MEFTYRYFHIKFLIEFYSIYKNIRNFVWLIIDVTFINLLSLRYKVI